MRGSPCRVCGRPLGVLFNIPECKTPACPESPVNDPPPPPEEDDEYYMGAD